MNSNWSLCLIVAGALFVLGACVVSRYVTPDWTGAIVGLLAAIGIVTSFVAGLLSRD